MASGKNLNYQLPKNNFGKLKTLTEPGQEIQKPNNTGRQFPNRGPESIQYGRPRSSVHTNKSGSRKDDMRQKSNGRRYKEGRIQLYARPKDTNREIQYRRRTKSGQRCDETSR